MTFNDSSSIILIVGAIAILAFVVHGLWFSGRSINRKLIKGSSEDQEIAQSEAVGKVRIVMPKVTEEQKNETANPDSKVETFVTKQEPKLTIPDDTFEPQLREEKVSQTYELNLFSGDGRPYKGLDLEELFSFYGFIRGDNDIFCVYEEPQSREHVVFRICSLEAPYSFPAQMNDFQTKAIALYMQLPPKGKAAIYFKAMRIGAKYIVERFGGVVRDNNNKEVSEDMLDATEKLLRDYDKSEE